MEEIWKDIEGYEGLYQVSNHNQVKSLPKKCGNQYDYKEVILKPYISNRHYKVVLRNDNGLKHHYVHVLVAKAFGIWKEGCEIHHIDGNPLNNEPSNLEAIERENHLLKHSNRIAQYTLDNQYCQTFDTLALAEKATNASRFNISACCAGRRQSAGGFKWRYAS